MLRKSIGPALLFVALFTTAALGVYSQPAARTADAGRKFAGEKLVYEGKISKMLMSFSVAELTFAASEAPGSDALVITANAVSKGTLVSLFHYSFQQQINSNIELAEFRASRTDKHDVQKERIRDSEAVFDYAQHRVTFVETDPNDRMRAPRRIASDISDPSHDLISAIYYLRLQDLSVGKHFELEVSDSGLVYKIPVIVTGKEKQRSPFGKVECWRVEPQIFGPGHLIEKDGSLTIWYTADERRVPVAAKIKTGIGTITVKLKQYQEPRTAETARLMK